MWKRSLLLDYENENKKLKGEIERLKELLKNREVEMKIVLKNIEAGKKYTHYGCTQVHYNQFNDIKSTIKSYEAGNFTSSDGTQLEKFDVSIDCHSSLLKLTGLILLAFLL